MMRSKRGFTLMELMIVVSVVGILASAGGALYLEGRVSAARIEAQLQLQREASLAAEAIGRDLRSARTVSADADGLDVELSTGGKLRWQRTDGKLVRTVREPSATTGSAEPWIVARAAEQLTLEPWEDRGWKVHLGLARELLPGRTVRADRDLLVRRTVR